jgi:hypothetical protein
VWVRSAAIRPVPTYAQLPNEALADVEAWLGDDEDTTESRLSVVFDRFELEQPIIADRLSDALARTSDEVAIALGYFLSLVIWRAFDEWFGPKLGHVDHTGLCSVEEALSLDEQLRGADPAEAVDSDDVIAMEQPHVLHFIHEHLDAALDLHADRVDVDAVHDMYRLILVQLLALSYAVAQPIGHVNTTSEIHA